MCFQCLFTLEDQTEAANHRLTASKELGTLNVLSGNQGCGPTKKKNNTPNSSSVILIMKSDKPRYIFFHDQRIKQLMWCNYQHDCNQGALKCLWPLLSKFWTTKSHRYILQDCSAQPQSQVWWWDTWHVKMASILRSKILRLKCRVALKM
jgi:hypothetical protein